MEIIINACYRAKPDWGGEQFLHYAGSSSCPSVATTSPIQPEASETCGELCKGDIEWKDWAEV